MGKDFNTEQEEKYNWLDGQEDPKKKDQHFGAAIGNLPQQIFNDGPYETLDEGCYRRLPAIGSDEIG